MERSFYHFVLSFRGGPKGDAKTEFAERMFYDVGFPKDAGDFDQLSRYIEELADPEMPSVVFDEIFTLYKERCELT